MNDKVVVITGSSCGIGAEAARAFSKLGARLILHGTNERRLLKVVDSCQELSPIKLKPSYVLANFSAEEEVKKFFDFVDKEHQKIDILVNNAGGFQFIDVLSKDSYNEFKHLMQINFLATVQLTTLLLSKMQHEGANIINISSNITIRPLSQTSAYVASKAALEAYTKALAIDFAPKLRVNCISPGPVATLIQEKMGVDIDEYRKHVGKDCLVERVGETEDITRAILFLADSSSSFITGANFVIDGGSSLKPSTKIANT